MVIDFDQILAKKPTKTDAGPSVRACALPRFIAALRLSLIFLSVCVRRAVFAWHQDIAVRLPAVACCATDVMMTGVVCSQYWPRTKDERTATISLALDDANPVSLVHCVLVACWVLALAGELC